MLVNFGFKTTLIVLITIAMAVMGVINSSQKSDYITPDDGGGWIKTSRGVEAVILEKNGPEIYLLHQYLRRAFLISDDVHTCFDSVYITFGGHFGAPFWGHFGEPFGDVPNGCSYLFG